MGGGHPPRLPPTAALAPAPAPGTPRARQTPPDNRYIPVLQHSHSDVTENQQ